MLGLREDIVKLLPYTPQWKRLFEAEKARLQNALGHYIVDVQHIGSTAIPGIVAKPIIDMSVGVVNFEEAFICIAPLQRLGYEYLGENGIPRRHYFRRGYPKHTHHLHMVEITSEDRQRTVLFRDYLCQHPEAAQQYAILKLGLAAQYPTNRPAYIQGKAPFIERILAQARLERQWVV
jgi:GrpB-like predicted nucleotidyltransferase (UPF0157 family)